MNSSVTLDPIIQTSDHLAPWAINLVLFLILPFPQRLVGPALTRRPNFNSG
jgi:hypothetical protein